MNTLLSSRSVILDCTFRDGGYYTNWSFSDELVNDYLSAMAALPVNVIELGFSGKGPGAGAFANVDNVKARQLRFSKTTKLAVMIDAKDYLECSGGIEAKLDRDLGPKLNDGIDIVRIAVNYRSAHECGELIEILIERDYHVCLNLMQIDMADQEELQKCIESVQEYEGLDAVYIADSLGSMRPARVKDIVSKCVDALHTDVGFHAHDNSGLAIANALCASEAGSTWLDCTVAGMGRGAGNACTEQLLPVAATSYTNHARYQLQQLIVKHFNPLKQQHGWGDSLFYQIGAANGIHPTFVQEALSDCSLSGAQAFHWICRIPSNSTSFSRNILETARQCAFAGMAPMHAEMETRA